MNSAVGFQVRAFGVYFAASCKVTLVNPSSFQVKGLFSLHLGHCCWSEQKKEREIGLTNTFNVKSK